MFAEDDNNTLWFSSGGSGDVLGWLDTKMFDETGDEEKSPGRAIPTAPQPAREVSGPEKPGTENCLLGAAMRANGSSICEIASLIHRSEGDPVLCKRHVFFAQATWYLSTLRKAGSCRTSYKSAFYSMGKNTFGSWQHPSQNAEVLHRSAEFPCACQPESLKSETNMGYQDTLSQGIIPAATRIE